MLILNHMCPLLGSEFLDTMSLTINCHLNILLVQWYYCNYRILSNLIRTSFCRFLKRKKKLVGGSNPHLSFNRPLCPAPSEVAWWVSAVWKAIPESVIVRSFKKYSISNALDGYKDDILWEDDGEDKDDSDWVTDNDSVMSDDGESDE